MARTDNGGRNTGNPKKRLKSKTSRKHSSNKEKIPDPDKVTVMKFNGGELHAAKKGYTANPYGRPRKFVSSLAKEIGYTQTDVKDCMEAILGMSEGGLKKVVADKEGTVLERTIAKALLKGVKNGTLGNLESVITRSFGYPNKSIDIKSTGDRPLATLNVTVVKGNTPELSGKEEDVSLIKDGKR
jgi:hypothetical protein